MIIFIFAGAYFLGSVSFSIIAGYLIRGEDLRTKGSGNAGATNAFRVLGWKIAVPVLMADFLKAFLPVFFASSILSLISAEELPLTLVQLGILLFVVLGHVFPLWFRFKGGKGVAAAAGGITALFPPAGPVCLIVFVLILVFSRYVSLASMITAWFLPLFYSVYSNLLNEGISLVKLLYFISMAFLISIFHRSNIRRLLKGEERKIHLRGPK